MSLRNKPLPALAPMASAPAPTAADEAARLAALHGLRLLDTAAEAAFDDIVALASHICGTPTALISLIDNKRQWFKASVGFGATETPREFAFCTHAIVAPEPVLVVADASQDPRFRDNPLVTGEPRIRFYAGVPIGLPGGSALGTVCVIDTVPRGLDAEQSRALQALARHTGALLELRGARLEVERQAAALEAVLRRADEARRHSAEQLEMVLRGGNLGLWDLHVPSGRFTANERERSMLGYDAAEALPESMSWRSVVHPDDRSTIHSAMAAHVKGEADFYACEHRMHHRDGSWVWVASHGTIVERDDAGAPLRIVGTHTDITERLRNRHALQNTRNLLQRTGDIAKVGGWELDLASGQVTWTTEVYRIHELDVSTELHLVNALDFYPPAARPTIEAAIAAAIAHGTRWDLELPFVTAKGRLLTVRAQGEAVFESGAAVRLFGAFQDITELHETQRQLEQLARVDALTGLPNRRHFEERIADTLLRAKRTKQTMALMFLDIDHFKRINDTLGHAGGDAVLCEFASRLKACVRATDHVARLAGDEFVVLLEGLSQAPAVARELQALAAKVVACVRPPFMIEGAAVTITTSVGVATCRAGEHTAAQLLAQADGALYCAKTEGRDRYAIV